MLLLNRNRLQNWKKKRSLCWAEIHFTSLTCFIFLTLTTSYCIHVRLWLTKGVKSAIQSRLWGVGSDIFFEFNIILQWFCCLHASLCAFITFSARKKIKLLTRCPGCPSVLCACACVCVCVPARISICVLAVFVPCEWSVCKCTNPLPFVSLVF